MASAQPTQDEMLEAARASGEKHGKKAAKYLGDRSEKECRELALGSYWHESHPRSDGAASALSLLKRQYKKLTEEEFDWKNSTIRQEFAKAFAIAYMEARGQQQAKSKKLTRFQKIAVEEGLRVAESMSLKGEKKKPSEETLKEWAEDGWYNAGIPALEAADAGEDDFEGCEPEFIRSFVEAMKKRLKGSK